MATLASLFAGVATLAASVITGELWKHYGAGVPFYASASVAVLAAMLLLVSPKK